MPAADARQFMIQDLAGVAASIVLFAPSLLAPGFIVAWIFRLFDFRKQPVIWQMIVSVPLSVALTPILGLLIGSWLSMPVSITIHLIATASMLAILVKQRVTPARPPWWIWCAPALWTLVILEAGLDVGMGGKLYPPLLIYDFNLRTALIDHISWLGLPARNALYFPGESALLRYHYLWFIACSAVQQMAPRLIDARTVLAASDVWCGWSLMSTIALYLRFFHVKSGMNLWKRIAWGCGLCWLAGLDIVPTGALAVLYLTTGAGWTYGSLEWWNQMVTPLMVASLWVAHHAGAVAACMTGFLVVWHHRGRVLAAAVVIAGLAFASATGMSIYVGFVFAVFLGVWLVLRALQGRFQEVAAWSTTGIVAGIALLPWLRVTMGPGHSSGAFIEPSIRPFTPLEVYLPDLGIDGTWLTFLNLLALPVNYLFETGAWVLMAVLVGKRMWRRRRRPTDVDCAAIAMFVTSFLLCTFFRSAVIVNNDLGWRGILIAQIILLVWAVDPFRAWWRSRRIWLGPKRREGRQLRTWGRRIAVLASLGLLSVAVDVILNRTYLLLQDHNLVTRLPFAERFEKGHHRDPSHIGERTFQMRRLYDALSRQIPREAIVQGNPNVWDEVYHGLYAHRQTAAFDTNCGSAFGGDPAGCAKLQSDFYPIFNDPSAAAKIDIDAVCRAHQVSALVVEDLDPVFRERSSWVWKRQPLIAEARGRAYLCGSQMTASREH